MRKMVEFIRKKTRDLQPRAAREVFPGAKLLVVLDTLTQAKGLDLWYALPRHLDLT